jgi:hypothetical protein
MVEFINRNGNVVEFNRLFPTCIEMKNVGDFCRVGGDGLDKLSMVDPSGGPYIRLGLDMDCFADEWKGLIVDKIEKSKGEGYLLYVKEVDMDG